MRKKRLSPFSVCIEAGCSCINIQIYSPHIIMWHSRKCSHGFLWGSWQPSGSPSRTSSLPACSQTMASLAVWHSLAWDCSSGGSPVVLQTLGLSLQGSNVWLMGGVCAKLLKHLRVQKPLSSSWGNSEVKGCFWGLNCDILKGTETLPVHALVVCPACNNHVVPSLGGCGQTQQLSFAPYSACHYTALPAVRGLGKDLQAWPGLPLQDNIKLV